MLNLIPKNLATVAGVLLTSFFMVSCEKNVSKRQQYLSGQTTTTTTTSTTPTTTSTGSTGTGSTSTGTTAALYTALTNFTRTDGAYTSTMATADYKSAVNGWADTRMNISSGTLRSTLTKNVVGPDGGLVSWVDVPDASEYQLSYDMMFDANFDWSLGGKVGYGFLLGEGNTGGDPGWDGNGGSARIMWYNEGGRVFLKPYVYYKDQPGTYGNDFAKTYPATGNIQKGVWYNVKMYVKSNTGSNTDGRLQIVINGTTVIDQAIRWTTNDLQRLVNRVTFETFRGGADATWTSATDGQVYFDNVSWSVLKY
jgi:hypothetical protein